MIELFNKLLPKFKYLVPSTIIVKFIPEIFCKTIAIEVKKKSIAAWVIYIEYDNLPSNWKKDSFSSVDINPDSNENVITEMANNIVIKTGLS